LVAWSGNFPATGIDHGTSSSVRRSSTSRKGIEVDVKGNKEL
jgi:hypothetical protein